jgi:predicted CXXCH cytochrome family protein
MIRALLTGVIAGVVAALIALSLGSGGASADNGPHVKGAGATADSCAACHRAHTAQADKLLKQSQPGLCYTCHGTGATGANTDVQDGKLRSSGAALRAGGFDYALINTSDATADTIGVLSTAEAVTSWHTTDGSTGTLWGNGPLGTTGPGGSYQLRCGACHDPHGNQRYRILRPVPPGSGGSGQDVTDETSPVYSTTNYFDVSYVSGAEISGWCAQCHTRYLASDDHQTSDAIYTYRHKSDGTGNRPPCIKCHAAHGTNAATTSGGYSEAVPWPGGGSGTTDLNNSRLLKMDNRGICQKCHNK